MYHMVPNFEEHSFYVFADEPSNYKNCTLWKFDVCIYTYVYADPCVHGGQCVMVFRSNIQ